MQIKQLNWPHFAERDPHKKIRHLVVHCFAFSVSKSLKLWDKFGVGPHYMIDNKGQISQFVGENKVAWHAGKSCWRGDSGLNATSIGIELYTPSFGQKPYPKAQLDAFVKLATQIIKKHHIRPENVVGHSDIAPTRKLDPNFSFPWKEMAKYGIGLWPKKQIKQKSLKRTKTLLKEIGYDVSDEKAALLAFMRHFMPERVPVDRGAVDKMEENLPKVIAKMPKEDKEIRQILVDVAAIYNKKN
ncbi:MAG: N-acetylmuramoyl-L-alanine amidase [Alphaproteobacteria bacterium]|nr:N-acetylmuramoyl-L-alanine amidase [Alphaproteobacteria bacterium]